MSEENVTTPWAWSGPGVEPEPEIMWRGRPLSDHSQEELIGIVRSLWRVHRAEQALVEHLTEQESDSGS